MHKEMKVQNTGHGVHVHARADDDVGSIDFKIDVNLKDKAHVPAVQAAWADTAAAFEWPDNVPKAIRESVMRILEHVADMEQRVNDG